MSWFSRTVLKSEFCAIGPTKKLLLTCKPNSIARCFKPRYYSSGAGSASKYTRVMKAGGCIVALSVCASLYASSVIRRVNASSSNTPQHKPIRTINSSTDKTGLKLTLYQYQTCPFCTKVRTYLDFMGYSYNVVEVNSVWRTEMKWSKYKKVPVLLIDGHGPEGYMQLNDSSVIISILEGVLINGPSRLEHLADLYPQQEETDKYGTKRKVFPTRYNIIFDENVDASKYGKPTKEQKQERKWRLWVDDWLVHTLSPNIYRTPSEALAAFRYFDEVGQWHTVFSGFERRVVIYVGATAMYFLGKRLKKKYGLGDDVRHSLYEACEEWSSAVKGNRTTFLGGNKPNLADLAVYGALNSIEGCEAFQDTLRNTDIGPWYEATKQAVASHAGAHALQTGSHA